MNEIFFCFVTVRTVRSDKKFANYSISTCDFCKDLGKFACFGTFERKWAYPIMKTLKNRKFDTY